MTGTYEHNIDAKGRLFIPARLREELGDKFYLTLSLGEYLWAHTNKSWKMFEDKYNSLPIFEQEKMSMIYGNAKECELDGQGRILVPQFLRDRARLGKNVTVVGTGERAQIWDSDAWATVNARESTPENIAKVFRELGF